MKHKPLIVLTNFLAAIAPYFAFMEYHDYPYFKPEAMLYFLFFACFGVCAGLIAAHLSFREGVMVTAVVMFLSYDLQFDSSLTANIVMVLFIVIVVLLPLRLRENGYKILTTGLAALIASTLIIGVEDASSDVSFTTKPVKLDERANKPIIIHIVLDEHIGLEGVPTDIPGGPDFVRDLHSQYKSQGYTTFGGAYSEHAYTRFSLALAFNNVEILQGELQMNKGARRWAKQNFQLVKNAYLKQMSERGYRVYIRQSKYFDLCRAQGVNYARCRTYDFSKLESIASADMPVLEKLLLFTSSHFGRSRIRKSLLLSLDTVEKGWNVLSGQKSATREILWFKKLFSWEPPISGHCRMLTS